MIFVCAGCQTPTLHHGTYGNQARMAPTERVPSHPSRIAPVAKSRWKYIIIHHSATDFGNAAEFDRMHKERGWDGVGYDFVIGNGTRGTGNGEVEETYRWKQQIRGAHCKAGNMNVEGIGICLVGNFSKSQVGRAQMISLIRLIRKLQKEYGIPKKNVMGHGNVLGANTQCPGNNFPWKVLYRNLD